MQLSDLVKALLHARHVSFCLFLDMVGHYHCLLLMPRSCSLLEPRSCSLLMPRSYSLLMPRSCRCSPVTLSLLLLARSCLLLSSRRCSPSLLLAQLLATASLSLSGCSAVLRPFCHSPRTYLH
jgi:hypothetical protein